ncbi:hypothetical protein CRUP_030599 [Coryphaenoides rupestris]|nr:hypothetical protein CRUP_030599 [Coryphaenoides rupestris]
MSREEQRGYNNRGAERIQQQRSSEDTTTEEQRGYNNRGAERSSVLAGSRSATRMRGFIQPDEVLEEEEEEEQSEEVNHEELNHEELNHVRLTPTHNINGSYCLGSAKKYQLCPIQPCPSFSLSFKQHQCTQFNSKTFGKTQYQWIPLYPADYISISNKPCDLQCSTESGERQILVPAHDGTFCRDAKLHGVCIEGVSVMDSFTAGSQVTAVASAEGTALPVSASRELTGRASHSYIFITNIPAGARDIQIIERRKTENILGGATAEGLEYIIAQGPTQQGLNLMYYNLNGKLPHITYEYTLPRDITRGDDITRRDDMTRGDDMTSPPPLRNHTHNEMDLREGVANDSQSSAEPVAVGQLQGEESVQEPSPPPAAMLVYRPLSDVTGDAYNGVEEPRPPAGYRSGSSNSIHSEPGNLNHTHPSKPHLFHHRGHFLDLLLTLPAPPPRPINQSSGLDNTLASKQYSDSSTTLLGAGQNNHTHTHTTLEPAHLIDPAPGEDTPLGEDTPPGDALELQQMAAALTVSTERWETSGWSECSRTCGEGLQVRTVRCWKMMSAGLDSSVYDSLCLSHDLHKPANRKCSARCGARGLRTREVRCSMETRLCNDSSQPIGSQECEGPPCDRRWTVSDWGPCSGVCGRGRMVRAVACRSAGGVVMSEEHKTCGSGIRVREVKCYQGEELVTRGHSCDSSLKPEARQSCDVQSCPTEPPAPPPAPALQDQVCLDKPTANCALVLKIKLCSHWYYRKACCQACSPLTP